MSAGAVLLGTAFAVALIASATVAVAIRDARLAVIGLLVALFAAPFLAEPMADLRGVTARLAGAALGAYPLWMLYRGTQETTTASRGGVVIDGLVAVVAALTAVAAAAGWDVAASLGGDGAAGLGPQLQQAGVGLARPFLPAIGAGAALLVLAISPVAFAREPLRLTIGLTLGLLGMCLVWTGLAGPPTPFTDLAVAITLAAICASGAVMIAASRRAARPLPATQGLRPLPPLHLPHRPGRPGRGRGARGGTAGQRPSGSAGELSGPAVEGLDARAKGSGAPAQDSAEPAEDSELLVLGHLPDDDAIEAPEPERLAEAAHPPDDDGEAGAGADAERLVEGRDA